MTLLVVLIAVAVVVLWLLARRYATGVSDRRSIERHERRLHQLGDVASRSDAAPDRLRVRGGDPAGPHLGPSFLSDAVPVAPPSSRPRIVTPPVVPPPPLASNAPLVFGDDTPVRPPAESDDLTPTKRAPRVRGSRTWVRSRGIRIGLPAAALVGVGGIIVGVLASSRQPSQNAAEHSTTTSTPAASSTTTTTTPSAYRSSGVVAGVATYALPAGSHTIGFASTSTCWIGVQSSASGPYLWMDTIAPGGRASYVASSDVVVRIGAPHAVSVTVDGMPLVFPAGQSQPFDLALTTSPN